MEVKKRRRKKGAAAKFEGWGGGDLLPSCPPSILVTEFRLCQSTKEVLGTVLGGYWGWHRGEAMINKSKSLPLRSRRV